MNDGMNRTSFEEAIRYIFCDRFGWGDTIAKVITHEYTNWTHREDPIANRETYISVSRFSLSLSLSHIYTHARLYAL